MIGEILLYLIIRVSFNEYVFNNYCIIKRRYIVYNKECINISC